MNYKLTSGFIARAFVVVILCAFSVPVPAGNGAVEKEQLKLFKNGNLQAVRTILESKDNYFSDKPISRLRALHEAVGSGNKALLKYLKAQGWFEECRKAVDCYLIHFAAWHDVPLDTIKFLMSEGFDVSALYDNHTTLEIAARYGHIEAVKLFCELGVDQNIRNNFEQTALSSAKEAATESNPNQGRIKMVIAFLESGGCVKK